MLEVTEISVDVPVVDKCRTTGVDGILQHGNDVFPQSFGSATPYPPCSPQGG